MKILHTADWHLGQKFLYNDREQEHSLALDWLLQTIEQEQVDVLIIAGDVFDIGNPPNYARKLYYAFLTRLGQTSCRHVVIIGGNHDSPAMLNAPKMLLEAMQIHVIGAATDDLEEEIIVLKNPNNEPEMVVAAVPFLRDRDLRTSISGESSMERIERIKAGIFRHYQTVGELVKPYAKHNIPLVTTGHLYAKGATAAEEQNNIYIGNMDNISAEEFPAIFDYVALGHLHRPQAVGESYHIRYSGSIIPLSFSEIEDQKSVSLIQFENRQLAAGIKEIPVPLFRSLHTIKGDLTSVQKKLDKLNKKLADNTLPAWIEVIIDTDNIVPNLDILLNEYVQEMNMELLKIRTNRKYYAIDAQVEEIDLDELSPADVFAKKCESFGSPPEEMKELQTTFLELQQWMQEQDAE